MRSGETCEIKLQYSLRTVAIDAGPWRAGGCFIGCWRVRNEATEAFSSHFSSSSAICCTLPDASGRVERVALDLGARESTLHAQGRLAWAGSLP